MIQCRICYHDFAFDASAKDKGRLPVQSSKCSHILCYECVVSIFYSSACSLSLGSQDDGVTVACPECRAPDAYDLQNTIFSLAICDLLQERQKMLSYVPEESRDLFQQGDNDGQHNGILYTLVSLPLSVWRRKTASLPSKKELFRQVCQSAYWGIILLFGPVNQASNRGSL